MVRILVSDKIHEDGLEILREFAEVDVLTGLTPEQLIAKIGDYDAIVVRSATKVTADVIAAGRRLKAIGRAGVGLDNIDAKAAESRGIAVMNSPEASTVAVAELTIGLMLSYARKIPRADSGTKLGKWEKKELMGTELRGKVLGIIGTGKIGKSVGRIAAAFRMKLLLYDAVRDEEFAREVGGKYVDLETLLKDSDYVTIHVPLTPETRHMIGRGELSLMKPTAVLVNTSRGAIVDEKELVAALSEKRIGGACLDVFEKEPLTESPLFSMQNTVLTPHIAASTVEAQKEAAIVVAQKMKKFFEGKT
ncbi:MAG: hydroxyacid dehydrogenase [Candidatus Hadarchaeales archaeon]